MAKMRIKSMHLENFRGIKDKEFDFSGKTSAIKGKNASGKTTIPNAYFWLMADKDIGLNSNPNIKPIGVDECTPTVSIVIDVDGKEVTLCKSQRIKSHTEEDGTIKISSANSYSVNAVPKTERDFKAYLEELGLPTTEMLLLMSHTDVFTSMKKADMRKILFDMIGDIDDKEIAEHVLGIDDLKELLQNYQLDEIEMMQKASIKKVNEQLDIIPGKIEGLELAKTDSIDVAEKELLVNSLTEKIDFIQGEIKRVTAEKNELISISSQLLKLQFDRSTELEWMNEMSQSARKELESKLNITSNKLVDCKRRINFLNDSIKQSKSALEMNEQIIKEYKKDYEGEKAKCFDETSLICPVCGQRYPESRISEMEQNFETSKKSKMDTINRLAKNVVQKKKVIEDSLASDEEALAKAKQELLDLENENAQLVTEIENYEPAKIEPTEKLISIDSEIETLTRKKDALAMAPNHDCTIEQLNEELISCKEKLFAANLAIGTATNNVRIDEQIEDLEEQRMQLQQAKADAERVLCHIEWLTKAKNAELTEKINSKFNIVKFSLFSYLKNGNYKDDCRVLSLDDKEIGVATNTALEMRMKIDICQSFQRFFGVELPVFVDGAEALDSDSYSQISCENQMIFLAVNDDATLTITN